MNQAIKTKLKKRLERDGICPYMANLIATRYCEYNPGILPPQQDDSYLCIMDFSWRKSPEGIDFWQSFYVEIKCSFGRPVHSFYVEAA